MSLAEMQIVLAVTSMLSLLSVAWLVLHARDVVLLLCPALPPLVPGEGRRLASFRAVSAAIALFGFAMAAQVLVVLRAATG